MVNHTSSLKWCVFYGNKKPFSTRLITHRITRIKFQRFILTWHACPELALRTAPMIDRQGAWRRECLIAHWNELDHTRYLRQSPPKSEDSMVHSPWTDEVNAKLMIDVGSTIVDEDGHWVEQGKFELQEKWCKNRTLCCLQTKLLIELVECPHHCNLCSADRPRYLSKMKWWPWWPKALK